MAITYIQAHCQVAKKPTAQTKTCQRACLSANAFLPTLKTNFFGNSSASIELNNNSNKLIKS